MSANYRLWMQNGRNRGSIFQPALADRMDDSATRKDVLVKMLDVQD